MKHICALLYLLFAAATVVVAQSNGMSPVPSSVPTIVHTPTKAPLPAPVPLRSCYTNLTEVDDLIKLKDPFKPAVYTLCPNTTYVMGVVGPGDTIVGGFPAIITRSYTTFQCGEDGKSSNNCILTGGQYQMIHSYLTFGKENKVNVVVKGFTFQDAYEGGILLVAPGDITFIDCIFEDHDHTGVIPLLYSFETTRRLTEISMMPDDSNKVGQLIHYHSQELKTARNNAGNRVKNQRELQVSGDVLQRQVVTFDNCIFRHNGNGPEGSLTQDGIMEAFSKFNDIIIKNSTFENNDFSQPVNGANGFAIRMAEGSTLTMADTCFLNNNFIGAGAILASRREDIISIENTYTTLDSGLTCPFVKVGAICINATAASCRGASIDNPSITPGTSGVSSTSLILSIIACVVALAT